MGGLYFKIEALGKNETWLYFRAMNSKSQWHNWLAHLPVNQKVGGLNSKPHSFMGEKRRGFPFWLNSEF
jgi:hypothetical protein